MATLVPNLVRTGWATGLPQKLWGHVLRTTYPVPRNSLTHSLLRLTS